MNKKYVEIAEWIPVSEVNGPGNRSVVWVQGCPKRCPGCWNPDYLKNGSDWRWAPEEIFENVRAKTHDFSLIEGVTFSGGEPFAQADLLSETAELFKRKGLSIMSYTGFTLEEIQNLGTPYTDLLGYLDILVDGEYVRELHCDRLWRSSLNQKVHFLTHRYKATDFPLNADLREFEINMKAHVFHVTGFPELDLLKTFR